MSEKRVYQDKMLNSKKEIVVCNWERGEGKTYSIFKKIIENNNGKYLYISFNFVGLRDCFKEYLQKLSFEEKEYIESTVDSRDKITIKYKNGNKIEIFYILNNESNGSFIGTRNIDIVFFDEHYPSKSFINKIIKPMGVKQIYVMMTDDNIEYIDSRQIKITCSSFCDTQIEELMIEYAETPKSKNTTLSRENILKQIKMLQDMKKVANLF